MPFQARAIRAVLALAVAVGADAPEMPEPALEVLVFSRTAGFRHDSIPAAVAAIRALGVEQGWRVIATEDAGIFTDKTLAPLDVVVFLSTTGDVLDDGQQAALERYVGNGGGWVGVHAAADTEYDWPWYGRLVGAYFESHPRIQEATIRVTDHAHPSTKMLPAQWTRRDEWYNYRGRPTGAVRVLATLDETSYEGGGMDNDHPIAWCHQLNGGRSWYTGGGHTAESWSEPLFLEHVRGGILWAAGRDGP